jgi:oligoendopeptidase F
MCAYQFYVRSLENIEEAWKDYVTLCSAGGTRPFVGLVQLANLKSPFVKFAEKSSYDLTNEVYGCIL